MDHGLINLWLYSLTIMSSLCTMEANSGEWGEWSVCSQSCGGGSQTRNRTCAGCTERRICNDRTCRIGTTAMIWVVMGISASILVIIFVILVGIFFIKEKADYKKAKNFRRKSSIVESTPGISRRTGTVDSNVDIKLNVMRQGLDHNRTEMVTAGI